MNKIYVYNKTNLEKPILLEFENLLAKPTSYCFETISKRQCTDQNIIHKNNKRFAPFTWEYVLEWASSSQQQAFNKFRNDYVKHIVIDYSTTNKCIPEPVGSKPTSARSDIDFNMFCTDKSVVEVIHDINEAHYKWFVEPLEVMFDVNLYGTVATFFKTKLCKFEQCSPMPRLTIHSQHVWAFQRTAEMIYMYAPSLIAMLSTTHQGLYDECIAQYKKLNMDRSHHKTMYLRNLAKYLKMENDNHVSASKIAHQYGLAKYYERETYRSVGALLHIVEKMKQLPPTMLHDSIYDNFGFILEILFESSNHCKKDKGPRIMKCCKYISRICNALMLMNPDNIEIQSLHLISKSIDKKRKALKKLSSADFKSLCKRLGCTSRYSEISFVKAVYMKLVSAL